jgi:Oxidoreductase family, NAD-binding Rossmann fold
MFRIGCVNIDTSHPGAFANKMNEAQLDMRYTSIFNDGFRSDGEVKEFMAKHNIQKRYVSLKEMAKNVDIAFIHDCNWEKHVDHAMPFIEAGIPVFLDKPLVGNLKDCFKLEELVKKGAEILGSSSLRYAFDIEEVKNKISANGETIATLFATNGLDEFNYGIHIMEGIYSILGPGVYSTKYLGCSRNGAKPAEQFLVKWNNGIQVIYQIHLGQPQPFHLVITTDKATHHLQVDVTKIYLALLKRIEAFLKGGKKLAPITELTETIKIYLAGKKSRETDGEEIALHGLCMNDVGFDGYSFEKEYSNSTIKKK